jgi:hypothetical protein
LHTSYAAWYARFTPKWVGEALAPFMQDAKTLEAMNPLDIWYYLAPKGSRAYLGVIWYILDNPTERCPPPLGGYFYKKVVDNW